MVNPRKNLAHCIDLLMLLGYGFHDAVTFQERLLKRYQDQRSSQRTS